MVYKSMATQNPDGLTPKQRRFVLELPFAKSQTEAAIKAGYSPGPQASVRASELVRNSNVLPAIQAQQEAASSAKVMSALKRKERLSRLAIPDPEHPDPVAAIKELNRIEGIGLPRGDPPVSNDNRTQILMAYSPEQLRALLAAMSKSDEKPLSGEEAT